VYTNKILVQVYSNITLVIQGYRGSTVLLEFFIVLRLVHKCAAVVTNYSGTGVVQEYRGSRGYRIHG
jgi:hypothetical protein